MGFKRDMYEKIKHVKNSIYCVFKGKNCLHFETKEKAELALKYINPCDYENPAYIPIRAYHCKCGFWHLTSKTRTIHSHNNYNQIPKFICKNHYEYNM